MDQTKPVPIQSAKQLKSVMAQHFLELDEAHKTKNKKILQRQFRYINPAPKLYCLSEYHWGIEDEAKGKSQKTQKFFYL